MIINSNLGVYIHIPFCRRKCNYCDFYLITNTNLINDYIKYLKEEIKKYSEIYHDSIVDSIFYGGGTPSILSDFQIYDLQNTLYKYFRVSDKSENTIESNPEDFLFAKEKFINLKENKINRISFGVQSFNNDTLKFLTRLHTANDAIKVIEEASKVFDNISIDMIYEVPGESNLDLVKSIKQAITLDIQHISAYSLIFEENTRLYTLYEQNKITKTISDEKVDQYYLIYDMLTDSGFRQYEVSNYSLKNFESRHNKKYWNYENYIGLGASSHSFFYPERWNNYRNIIKYIDSLKRGNFPFDEKHKLSKQEMLEEIIFLGLRSEGVNLNKFSDIIGQSFIELFSDAIKILISTGFANITNERFTLNQNGKILADEIMLKYFSMTDLKE